ncbi:hypothetical protein VT84_13905 [Gemmata sp. SH-PL17]|uniref:TIGR02996 domain-containing protein n=1 Tax=Gemmata sp. SH-PL17 TaxID=1630693 RepID=UPI00078EB08B|nr:TIGR02996 domain-containing protein [Gemmata sp. SH-PL17]AMV25488.1 hypothetical protein VT84_13905 [Gemmata sp. SH-PL17]
MSERDAFIARICAEPDEDSHRLVFADWLDEHGEPERAEFIRLQIAGVAPDWLAESESISPTTHQQKLHPFAVSEWRLCGWNPQIECVAYQRPYDETSDRTVFNVKLSRGFVSEIHLPCASFIAKGFAADLFRRQPVTRVVLTDKRPDETPGSAESPAYAGQRDTFDWCRESMFGSPAVVWSYVLPDFVYDKIKEQHPQHEVTEGSILEFKTEHEGLAALSDALVAWARNQAGLPAWAPATREVV